MRSFQTQCKSTDFLPCMQVKGGFFAFFYAKIMFYDMFCALKLSKGNGFVCLSVFWAFPLLPCRRDGLRGYVLTAISPLPMQMRPSGV